MQPPPCLLGLTLGVSRGGCGTPVGFGDPHPPGSSLTAPALPCSDPGSRNSAGSIGDSSAAAAAPAPPTPILGCGGLGGGRWRGSGGPQEERGCQRCAGGQLVCHLRLLSFAKPKCKNELKKT